MFETTIRYLGGLLSAYELSGQKFPVLLQKAKEVADKMAFAWVGVSIKLFYITVKVGINDPGIFKDNKIPFGFVDFTTNTPTVATVSCRIS